MKPSPFCVAKPPERRSGAEEPVAVVMEHAAGDVVGGIAVEAVDHDLGAIRDAVAVGIFDAIQALLESRKVAPVARPIVVVIGQPWILGAPLRRELAAIEGRQVRDGPEGVHERDPGGMRADVERQVVAARARRVERAALVEVERDGIDHETVGRPRGQLEPGAI